MTATRTLSRSSSGCDTNICKLVESLIFSITSCSRDTDGQYQCRCLLQVVGSNTRLVTSSLRLLRWRGLLSGPRNWANRGEQQKGQICRQEKQQRIAERVARQIENIIAEPHDQRGIEK